MIRLWTNEMAFAYILYNNTCNYIVRHSHVVFLKFSTAIFKSSDSLHLDCIKLNWFMHFCRCFVSVCHHIMQKDTCPAEWYMSNCHSANLRVRSTSYDWLIIDFGYMVQLQQIHRSMKGCCSLAFRCAMYLLPLDHVSQIQLSTNQNLFIARAKSQDDRWTCTCILPLDIVSPCIVWSLGWVYVLIFQIKWTRRGFYIYFDIVLQTREIKNTR